MIAGANADESVYDVAAEIGDTWRITFDNAKKTFSVKVLSTQFGLIDRSGSYTAVTTGNITTYTGTDLNLTVDARTRLLTGTIKLGSMSSNVSGTGYAATDVAKLAGNYIFLGAMRNASNGGCPFNPKGSLQSGGRRQRAIVQWRRVQCARRLHGRVAAAGSGKRQPDFGP